MFRRRRSEKDLAEEMEAHLRLEADQLREEGASEKDARDAARRVFGNITLAQESRYESGRIAWFDHLVRDLRFGSRMLFRSPGFALISILVLGLGIGANAGIFSVIHAVLLRPLPFSDPGRLVLLFERDIAGPGSGRGVVSLRNFLDWQAQSASFEAMGAERVNEFNLGSTVKGEIAPQRLIAAICSPGLFRALGVAPLFGRAFSESDDKHGAPRVVVISHDLWRTRFGAAPDVLQRSVRLDGQEYAIAGVMPPGFSYPRAGVQAWVPVQQFLTQVVIESRGSHQFYVVARLRRDVSIGKAAAELDGIAARIHEKNPDDLTGLGASLAPLEEFGVHRAKTPVLVLLGAVGCILLIACVNMANLLLASASKRRGEVAIRAALGATRGRLIRQLLTESVLLAILGAAFGLLLAFWLTSFLGAHAPTLLSRGDIDTSGEIRLSLPVFTFAGCIALVVGVLTGLVPAFQTTRTDLLGSLKEAARAVTLGRSQFRFRSVLIAVEVALSLVLLVSAGLLLRSFDQLLRVRPGVRTDHVLTIGLALDERYSREQQIVAFEKELVHRLDALPGVASTGIVTCLPADGYCGDRSFFIVGRPAPPGHYDLALGRAADPAYFSAMGIPLLRGRTFREQDSLVEAKPTQEGVVIISDSMARKYWPSEDPIGKRITFGRDDDSQRYQVIGIVGDVVIQLDAEPRPTIYVPLYDAEYTGFYAVLHTRVPPESLAPAAREQLLALDPDLPPDEVRTMEEVLGDSAATQRFQLVLVSAFALLAMVLAAVGLYGVLSYSVSQRTGEIGIRMALGADKSHILRLILLQGVKPAMAGLAAGWLGALAVAQLLRGLLFGIPYYDPLTFVAVPVLLLAIVLVACYSPAARATRLDPVIALRNE